MYLVHTGMYQLTNIYFIWGKGLYYNALAPPYTCPTLPVTLPTDQSQSNVSSHSFWFLLVHTSMYLVCISTYSHSSKSHLFPIRHHHPCDPHESPSYACPTLCRQNPAYPKSPRLSGFPSEACHAQTATSTC